MASSKKQTKTSLDDFREKVEQLNRLLDEAGIETPTGGYERFPGYLLIEFGSHTAFTSFLEAMTASLSAESPLGCRIFRRCGTEGHWSYGVYPVISTPLRMKYAVDFPDSDLDRVNKRLQRYCAGRAEG